MTGTIKLIRILLLIVIQHGGDDVGCKRSIQRGTGRVHLKEYGDDLFHLCKGQKIFSLPRVVP